MVFVGIDSTEERNRGNAIFPEKTINHPLFNRDDSSTQKYDIAVIKLSKEPSRPKPMRVNLDRSLPRPPQYVRAAGYGASRGFMGNNEPVELLGERGILRQVDVPVSTKQQCENNNQLPGVRIDNNMQVCAGYSSGQCDSW